MEPKDLLVSDMLQQMQRLIQRYLLWEKAPRDYGCGIPLHMGEIQTLVRIHQVENLTLVALARTLGITRGAVTQMIHRLEAKGLIIKQRHVKNDKEILLDLTPLGNRAVEGYHGFREVIEQDLALLFEKKSFEDLAKSKEIFNIFEFYLKATRAGK
jgi:DNA-binding MarR family transcriptional regulator